MFLNVRYVVDAKMCYIEKWGDLNTLQPTRMKQLINRPLLWAPELKGFVCVESRRTKKEGFTLIELMVVIAIMAIMVAVSLPSMRGIFEGQRQQQNLIRMGQILEEAQIAAQTHNTYVWVGISSQTAGGAPLTSGGVPVTIVTVVSGLTGSAGDLTNDASVPNASTAFLIPSQVFRNASCPPTNGGSAIDATEINALKSTSAPNVTTSSGIFATSDSSTAPLGIAFTQNWQGTQIVFSNIIQFNSTGQPMVSSAASNWIELLLGPLVGATAANSSGLLLSGLTGKVTLIP